MTAAVRGGKSASIICFCPSLPGVPTGTGLRGVAFSLADGAVWVTDVPLVVTTSSS